MGKVTELSFCRGILITKNRRVILLLGTWRTKIGCVLLGYDSKASPPGYEYD
jgi:hypothetical protein